MDIAANLTPHEVVVLAGPTPEPCDNGLGTVQANGSFHAVWARYPSAGEARAEARREQRDHVYVADDSGGPVFVPVNRVRFGDVDGLPEPTIGAAYIVSRITAEAARAQGRPTADLLIPDDVVRGADGQPVGCRSFSTL